MDDFSMEPLEANELLMSREARAKLKELALQATPGPWLTWDDGDVGTAYPTEGYRRHRNPKRIEKITIESKHIANCAPPDGAYIAAVDPQTILMLLAHIELLEARLEE